jgi:hypothetical protein
MFGANSGANYSVALQHFLGLVGGSSVFVAEKMRIGVQRNRGLRVACPCGDDMHRKPAPQQVRDVGMTQAVERDRLDFDFRDLVRTRNLA